MAVGRREGWQKGKRLATAIAEAAPNRNPIMVFIMRLFAAATMTDDGVLRTNRASARTFAPASAQSLSRLYWAAESEINRIVSDGGFARPATLPRSATGAEPSS